MIEEAWTLLRAHPAEGHWITASGERRLITWANRPLRGEDGQVVELVCTGLDITEREHAAVELRQLAAEQGALRRTATLVASARPARRRLPAGDRGDRGAARRDDRGAHPLRQRDARDDRRALDRRRARGVPGRRTDPAGGRQLDRPRDAHRRGGAHRRLPQTDGHDRRDAARPRLPVDGRGADRLLGPAVGGDRDRHQGRQPATGVLRAAPLGLRRARGARAGQHARARAAGGVARTDRAGRRRGAPAPGARPARRRPAAPRVARARAADGAREARRRPRERADIARRRRGRAGGGAGGAARARARHPPRRAQRARAARGPLACSPSARRSR